MFPQGSERSNRRPIGSYLGPTLDIAGRPHLDKTATRNVGFRARLRVATSRKAHLSGVSGPPVLVHGQFGIADRASRNADPLRGSIAKRAAEQISPVSPIRGFTIPPLQGHLRWSGSVIGYGFIDVLYCCSQQVKFERISIGGLE